MIQEHLRSKLLSLMKSKTADMDSGPTSSLLKDVTTTPGLLRLAIEIRLQIYDLLASEEVYKSEHDDTPFELHWWTEMKIMKASPITRVCQEIRYEAIPVFYGKYRWVVHFRIGLNSHRPWIETIDPYAFRCLRGIKFAHFANKDICGKIRSTEWNLDFQSKSVQASVACCEVKSKHQNPKSEMECQECIKLADSLASEINLDRQRAKQIAVNMLLELERVAFVTSMDKVFQDGWQSRLSRPMAAYLHRCYHGVQI